MNIRRHRRHSLGDDWPVCDYCDVPFTVGFEFTGEVVSGTRSSSLCVCDRCLDKAKKSSIGFLNHTSSIPLTTSPAKETTE